MKSFSYTLTDAAGIHARPAGQIVKEAKSVASTVTITANGKTADAKKLMALMSLGIKQGVEVTVAAEGTDEEEAIAKLERCFKKNNL